MERPPERRGDSRRLRPSALSILSLLLAVPGSLSRGRGVGGRRRLRHLAGFRANAPKRNALLLLVYVVVGVSLVGVLLSLL
ncbi:hypothetical protein [Haloarchaeobius sp. DT45]|uniref:hypothetical protein n=1 Tax=Haloarchaeobius sp. DT45 TaxID=3446116 RepID=UPI003F6ABAAA